MKLLEHEGLATLGLVLPPPAGGPCTTSGKEFAINFSLHRSLLAMQGQRSIHSPQYTSLAFAHLSLLGHPSKEETVSCLVRNSAIQQATLTDRQDH